MEKYPKCADPYLKKTSRLSFSKKHRMTGSPTTPIRKNILTTLETETSPASRNIKIVSHFGEESPSQEYDYSVIPMSQTSEIVSGYRDVSWGWKDKNVVESTERELSHIFPVAKNRTKKIEPPKKIEKTEGFYKFQKLLQAEGGNITNLLNKNLQLNDNCTKNNNLRTASPVETNDFKGIFDQSFTDNSSFLAEIPVVTKPETKQMDGYHTPKKNPDNSFIRNNVKSSNDINNLLDDSETDNLLIEISQKIECDAKEPLVVKSPEFEDFDFDDISFSPKSSKKIDFKMNDTFEEDTIDELLLSLPLDEEFLNKLMEHEKCDKNKKAFPRHNSMPSPNQIQKNILPRHSSSNSIRLGGKLSNQTNRDYKNNKFSICSPSSSSVSTTSLDSISTSVSDTVALMKICTKAEVEKKRQEAKLRRLESQRRQQMLNQKKSGATQSKPFNK